MKHLSILVLAFVLVTVSPPAQATNIIVGVNTVGIDRMNEQQQDAFVEQLRQYGVTTVRLGVDAKFTHFITRAYQRGIGTVAVVTPERGSEKIVRYRPSALSVGLIWGQAAFSTIDPAAFRTWFSARLDTLEAGGVRLTALEFGNEVNSAGYNGDFPIEATGRELGLSDLHNPHDPEASAIAAGYRVYLKALAELKQVRDASRLNKRTPIICAGLADSGPPGKRPGAKQDGVSVPDTIDFWRQNGLDQLVDGYGIHYYPPSQDPNVPVSARAESLGDRAFARCTSAKPCWLTEWGFPNRSTTCPLNDEVRVKLFRAEREAFKAFVKQGRLAAIIYYNWTALPGYDSQALFRCGALTDAGRLALSPM